MCIILKVKGVWVSTSQTRFPPQVYRFYNRVVMDVVGVDLFLLNSLLLLLLGELLL